MNWEAIGAVAEILGAIAVVVSLVYLAAQIGHNTRQLSEQNRSNRLTSLTAVGQRFTEMRREIARDPSLATIWTKGSKNLASLSAEERVRFDFFLIDLFWAWGIPWLHVQQGVFDEDVWEFTRANLPLYAAPGVREWWFTSPHRQEYPAEFAQLVDGLLESSSDTSEPTRIPGLG